MLIKQLVGLLNMYTRNGEVVVRTENGDFVRVVRGTTPVAGTQMLELILEDTRVYSPFFRKEKK